MQLSVVYKYKWSKCKNENCKFDKATESDLVNCNFCNYFLSAEMKLEKEKIKKEAWKWN
jgi:hypothetical protein